MSRPLRFILDGKSYELEHVDPTRTVLQFLREDLGLYGTKEGCAEGDCGACTVALVDIDRNGERLDVRAINSCIQFLASLDGRELVTVQGLKNEAGELHPVQKAMLDCHGSQCGFCTPGFVMSLFAHYKNNGSATRREIDDALAGNLCRCTGYQPIVDAAMQMYNTTQDDADWLRIANSRSKAAGLQETGKVEKLRDLRGNESLEIADAQGGRKFFAPRSAEEVAATLKDHIDATIVAGGTDAGLWVTKQHRRLQTVIYLGNATDLGDIRADDDFIDIGAAVTLSAAMPVLLDQYPHVRDLFYRFASPPIRNAATLAGNVANGSPIGDSMPLLLALDTELVLLSVKGRRTLQLADFYLDYQKTALQPGEFVERVRVRKFPEEQNVRSYKISKRFDQDISAVCMAFRIRLEGNRVAEARIACGGVAAIPTRARRTEQVLTGKPWDDAALVAAAAAIGEDFQPISDMRASADYRLQVCRNLLRRYFLDSRDNDAAEDIYHYGR